MESFTGEIRIMGFGFAPKGWVVCDGQPASTTQYKGLFQQLGYRFGGSGATFNLPDLRDGSIALGTGAGPGLTPRALGDRGGVTSVTLTEQECPPHTHLVSATNEPGQVHAPGPNAFLARSSGGAVYRSPQNTQSMDARLVGGVRGGDGRPHENRMPFQALYYCICLLGTRTAD